MIGKGMFFEQRKRNHEVCAPEHAFQIFAAITGKLDAVIRQDGVFAGKTNRKIRTKAKEKHVGWVWIFFKAGDVQTKVFALTVECQGGVGERFIFCAQAVAERQRGYKVRQRDHFLYGFIIFMIQNKIVE